jgi:hypothetical protein
MLKSVLIEQLQLEIFEPEFCGFTKEHIPLLTKNLLRRKNSFMNSRWIFVTFISWKA